jgi:hypothetical protein
MVACCSLRDGGATRESARSAGPTQDGTLTALTNETLSHTFTNGRIYRDCDITHADAVFGSEELDGAAFGAIRHRNSVLHARSPGKREACSRLKLGWLSWRTNWAWIRDYP